MYEVVFNLLIVPGGIQFVACTRWYILSFIYHSFVIHLLNVPGGIGWSPARGSPLRCTRLGARSMQPSTRRCAGDGGEREGYVRFNNYQDARKAVLRGKEGPRIGANTGRSRVRTDDVSMNGENRPWKIEYDLRPTTGRRTLIFTCQ